MDVLFLSRVISFDVLASMEAPLSEGIPAGVGLKGSIAGTSSLAIVESTKTEGKSVRIFFGVGQVTTERVWWGSVLFQ
jgi:hypothetical protein